MRQNEIVIRGRNIDDIIEKLTFTEAVFLLLRGRLPDKNELRMMNAILVSCIDQGTIPQSTTVTRIVTSSGVGLCASVAAGILSMGEYHGGAIESAAKIFQNSIEDANKNGVPVNKIAERIVSQSIEKKEKIPGYGHVIHTDDPRTKKLMSMAHEMNIVREHVTLAEDISKILHEKGKKIPLNVDGAIAAIISDMGFDWRMGNSFFLLSRTPGLIAHYFEEKVREKPLRIIHSDESEYDG